MKNKLTLAKYLIYGSAAYRLCWSIWALIYNSIYEVGWAYGWNNLSVWQFFYGYVLWHFRAPLLIYFSYQRFEKEKPQFNWGLYAIAIYSFLSFIGSWIVSINTWGWDSPNVTAQFKIWTTYPVFLALVALIWGVCLLAFVVDRKAKGRTDTYQKSDEISDKEFIPVILLCFFLGGLGVHRFYSGKIGTGILMILTLGGLGIWVIVDFIMLCIGSFRDIDGKIIRYQRAVYIAPDSHANTPELSKASELEQFYELKNKGVISEEEFNKKKEELLR